MNDETAEPLPVLLHRLDETTRGRNRWYLFSAANGVMVVVVAVAGAYGSDVWTPIFFILLFSLTTTLGLRAASERNGAMRVLRERIAWAQAEPGQPPVQPQQQSHTAAWIGVLGTVAAAVIGLVTAIVTQD